MTARLVYLDTETTGLDPARDSIIEIAYAVDSGPIGFFRPPSLFVHPDAAAVNHYWTRFGSGPDRVAAAREYELLTALDGATLVGANPAFDAAFLRARWGFTPWKYRLLDLEAYALPYLGLPEPKGLAFIAKELQDNEDDEIPTPDHTAAGDVDTLRACHVALRDIYDDLVGVPR